MGQARETPEAGTLIFDGSCGFCRRWVERILRLDRRRTVRAVPLQHPDGPRLSGRTRAELAEAVHFVHLDGAVFAGAAAVREMLGGFPGGWTVTGLCRIPGVMQVAERAYRWVARRWGPVKTGLGPGTGGRYVTETTLQDAVMSDEQQTGGPLDEQTVRQALRKVKDPEAGINIIDLGLVYDVAIVDDGKVDVKMTLTSPGCPAGGQIMGDADDAIRRLDGVKDVRIELVWEPYWTPERIDPKVRAYFGF